MMAVEPAFSAANRATSWDYDLSALAGQPKGLPCQGDNRVRNLGDSLSRNAKLAGDIGGDHPISEERHDLFSQLRADRCHNED